MESQDFPLSKCPEIQQKRKNNSGLQGEHFSQPRAVIPRQREVFVHIWHIWGAQGQEEPSLGELGGTGMAQVRSHGNEPEL